MLEDLAAHAYQRILSNGGITLNLQGHEPTSGYAYSPYPELSRVLPAHGLMPQHVHQYMVDHQPALSMPGNHLGAWHDQSSGNVFLDISHVGPPTPDTIAEAKKNKQRAVFDLSNFQEIPTGLKGDEVHHAAWQWNEEPPEFEFPSIAPKFYTDENDHRQSLLTQQLIPHVPQWQWTARVDPDWMRQWIATNGPYLAHYTNSAARELIHQNGLLPHDTEGIGSKYFDELMPRANHVYLRYPHSLNWDGYRSVPVFVDTRKLDWNRINADEDALVEDEHGEAFKRFGLERPVPKYTEKGFSHVEDSLGKYKSYGDWADQHQLNEPHHTAHSLNGSTVAVQGGVDPACFAPPDEVEEYMRANHPERVNDDGSMRSGVVPVQPMTVSSAALVRLYRGERPERVNNVPDWMLSTQGLWFTDDISKAMGYGNLRYVDVPAEVARASMVERRAGEFILPRQWANRAQDATNLAPLSYTREASRLNLTNEASNDWHFGGAIEPPLPGQRCYFHLSRPAVASGGFAGMCSECLTRYEHALLATRPDMREVEPEKLAAWIPPEGFGTLGPQSPEEHALMMLPPVKVSKCPNCGWYGKMAGGCPKCGTDLQEWEWEHRHPPTIGPNLGSVTPFTPFTLPTAPSQSTTHATPLAELYSYLEIDANIPATQAGIKGNSCNPWDWDRSPVNVRVGRGSRNVSGSDAYALSDWSWLGDLHSPHSSISNSGDAVDSEWRYTTESASADDVASLMRTLGENRPSLKEFISLGNIREHSEHAVEPENNFSTIQNGTPDGTDPWEDPEYVTMYHNVPTNDRARVMAHGLISSAPRRNPVWKMKGEAGMVQNQPEGVYLSKTPSVFHNAPEGTGVDLFSVRVHPSKLIKDPVHPGAMYHSESIMPEQIRMYRPFEGGSWNWRPWQSNRSPNGTKTAGPVDLPGEYYYHQAPTSERARIQTHGLIPGKPLHSENWSEAQISLRSLKKQPKGVYVTTDPNHFHMHGENDIWRIPASQIRGMTKDRASSFGYVIPHPVRPELHERFEDSDMARDDLARQQMNQGELPEGGDWQFLRGWQGEPNPELNFKQWGIGLPDRVIGKTEWDSSKFSGSADNWMQCQLGHQHWGLNGAAGLLLHHIGEDGQKRYLLQQRSPGADHAGTWSTPGGALDYGETPEMGAHRETEEEFGKLPPYTHLGTETANCGNWNYHTVHGQVPSQFDPTHADGESSDFGWFTRDEMNKLPLHPGFAPTVQKLAMYPEFLITDQAPKIDKFKTDEKDHEQSKKVWPLPEPPNPWKQAAADPIWLNDWIAKNGPFLVHETTPGAYQKIMQEGLLPHDTISSGSIYDGHLTPRPNHVYLRHPGRGGMNLTHEDNTHHIVVDLRKLGPDNLNPDEDAFMDHGHRLTFGLPESVTEVPLPGHGKWGNTIHGLEEQTGLHDEPVQYKSWGDWAEHHDLSHPEYTAHSLNAKNTIAHQGGIHPWAFTPMEAAHEELRNWQPPGGEPGELWSYPTLDYTDPQGHAGIGNPDEWPNEWAHPVKVPY